MKKWIAFTTCAWLLSGCATANEDMDRAEDDLRQTFDSIEDRVENSMDDVKREIKDDMSDADEAHPNTKTTSTSNDSFYLLNVPSYCNAMVGRAYSPYAEIYH